MEQPTNYKNKIDFSLSNNTSLIQPTQSIVKSKYKKSKCPECNKRRKPLDESHQICHVCYNVKVAYKYGSSGNRIIDDFIRYTQINLVNKRGKMEYVPYEQFINIKFIAEGGFSKIYKATWIDGPVNTYNNKEGFRFKNYTVVLKKINDSKNITSKELNELKVFYDIYKKSYGIFIGRYFGVTQDPNSQDIMIIMPYYDSGDLIHYMTKDFFNISWYTKLSKLKDIAYGLKQMHKLKIIHRDFHSGNIFFNDQSNYFIIEDTIIGDLGISKSATESTDDNENYGIIPYMAPEIFQGQKYTKASDIYSFGMIMWEIMTGRRPFWDRNHDTYLIIDICDGLRPPIVTNAPDGYIELMKECWHSDPEKRPVAADLHEKIRNMHLNETENFQKNNPTGIIESLDIGPATTNNPGAIYKSRPLSSMINSAMSLRSSRSQSISLEKLKRKFEDNLIENNDEGMKLVNLID
ncbi:Ypk2p [Rhizophagus irregularis DAOM 197198w]|uniref:Ypk2p n=1 Tax=Rhizophagus irregularis (strain DAOM 197198w) TaxID=1432141 RepID=A0A015IR38_RHIIW|nr:Ypk2p [Rhizophagus irregularis DAOM 197198w]